uniref:Uncharacterized protein n=1 Tax=Oryza glumipatula TaxID=40148 RepID=A0A0E0BQM1_9ORYZ
MPERLAGAPALGLKHTERPKSMTLRGEFSDALAYRKFSDQMHAIRMEMDELKRERERDLDDVHDGAHDGGGGALGVVAAGDDAVEELAALADLHDEVDGVGVLERLPEPHHVGVRRQRPHDGHLPPHVLHVHAAPELPLADRLARQPLPRQRVPAPPRHPELPPTQLLPDLVPPQHLLRRHHAAVAAAAAVAQHGRRLVRHHGARRVRHGGDRGEAPHVGGADHPPAAAGVRGGGAAAAPPLVGAGRPGHAAVAHPLPLLRSSSSSSSPPTTLPRHRKRTATVASPELLWTYE